MKQIFMNEKVLYFSLIGVLLGSTVPLLCEYCANMLSVIVYTFSTNFGIIAFILGLCFSPYLKLVDNKPLNSLLIVVTFSLSGVAYGCLLDLRFYTNQELSLIPLDSLMIPVAVSAFVYIFTVCFISLRNYLKMGILLTVMLCIPVIILSLPKIFLFNLPSFLVLISFFTLLINHLSRRTIANILANISLFLLVYIPFLFVLALIPMISDKFSKDASIYAISFGSCVLPVFGFIFYLIDTTEANNSEISTKKSIIDMTWILSSASLICNYAIITSPISFFNYIRSVNFFEKNNILLKSERKICNFFSVSTLNLL